MVGERIKQLRLEKGYSISELAKLAEVSKSYLSYIERDLQKNPSLHFLSKLATTLETSIEYLLGEETKVSLFEGTIDEEWILLIKHAIEVGITKVDFQNFIDFVKFQRRGQNKK